MMNEKISAAENPALAQQLVQAAISISQDGEDTETVTPVKVTPPSSGEIKLLAGIYNSFTGDVVDTAEVRELNGEDEEALSKINDYGKGLLEVLRRGVTKIGGEPATKDALDNMLAGDREYLILQIRIASLGSEIKLDSECPSCLSEQEFTIDLVNDVDPKRLDDPSQVMFTVDCNVGSVMVELPSGVAQRKLMSSTDRTAAELDTFLLQECVSSINGMPVVDPNNIKKLSIKDRRTIIDAIVDRNPGPRLNMITKTCSSCGQEVPFPLSLADLFRL